MSQLPLQSSHVANPQTRRYRSIESLDYWLAQFVYEIQRQSKSSYAGITLNKLAVNLHEFMVNKCSHDQINLFKKADPSFKLIHDFPKKRGKEMILKEVGVAPKGDDPVSVDEEATLWDKGVLNITTGNCVQFSVITTSYLVL